MVMKFPATCTANDARLEFSLRMQEELRLEHNKKGAERRDNKITEAEWLAWKRDYYKPRMNATLLARGKQIRTIIDAPVLGASLNTYYIQNRVSFHAEADDDRKRLAFIIVLKDAISKAGIDDTKGDVGEHWGDLKKAAYNSAWKPDVERDFE